MFVYSANDVIGDVMPYRTCLLTLYKCLFYSDFPQTTINKAINDLRKRLARFGAFWTFCAYYVNCVVALNMA